MDANILSSCIMALVTILGFVVTYFLNKRNFKEELNRQKSNIQLDKIAELPYKIQDLFDTIREKNDDKTILNSFKELMLLVFAYGSKAAIALATDMQEFNYLLASHPECVDKTRLIAYFILLLCQVKYDLTGIKINPQYWYRMRLTDYAKMKISLDNANNDIVKNLDLEMFLYIKN